MAELRKQDGVTARALEFAILTAARSGEVLGSNWEEIDLDTKLWTIPARSNYSDPLNRAFDAIFIARPRRGGRSA
jgi:integrase